MVELFFTSNWRFYLNFFFEQYYLKRIAQVHECLSINGKEDKKIIETEPIAIYREATQRNKVLKKKVLHY